MEKSKSQKPVSRPSPVKPPLPKKREVKPHVLSDEEEEEYNEGEESVEEAPVRNRFGMNRRPPAGFNNGFSKARTSVSLERRAPPNMGAANLAARTMMQARERSMSPIKTGNDEVD